MEGSAATLTQIVGQMQLFNSCLTKGLDSLLATGWRLPSVPFWIDLSNMTVCLLKASQRESLLAKEGTILVTLLWKWQPITLPIFYWLEACHRSCIHSREGITQQWENQKGISGWVVVGASPWSLSTIAFQWFVCTTKWGKTLAKENKRWEGNNDFIWAFDRKWTWNNSRLRAQ